MTDKIFMYDDVYAREHKVGALTKNRARLGTVGVLGIILIWLVVHVIASVFTTRSMLGIIWFVYGMLLIFIIPCVIYALWLAVRSETQRTAYIVRDESLYMVKLIGNDRHVLEVQGKQEAYILVLERALVGAGTWMKDWYQWIFNGEAEIRRLDELKVLRSTGKYTLVSYIGYKGKKKYWLIADAFPGLRDEILVNEGYYAKHATSFPDLHTSHQRSILIPLFLILCSIGLYIEVFKPMVERLELEKKADEINVMEVVPESLLEEICYDNYEYFRYDRSTVQVDRETGAFVYYIFGTFELDGSYYVFMITEDNDSDGISAYTPSETCEGWAYYVKAVGSGNGE